METTTVPLLISRMARVCINEAMSGNDIEEIFKRQIAEYDLDSKEQTELSQLLDDMGWKITKESDGWS